MQLRNITDILYYDGPLLSLARCGSTGRIALGLSVPAAWELDPASNHPKVWHRLWLTMSARRWYNLRWGATTLRQAYLFPEFEAPVLETVAHAGISFTTAPQPLPEDYLAAKGARLTHLLA